MEKKLRKSKRDVIFTGLCGGIANYFGLKASHVRLVWLLSIIFAGYGLFLYIALAIIVPNEEVESYY